MGLLLTVTLLGGLAPAQASATPPAPPAKPAKTHARQDDLLAIPAGKSTVIGGTIASVDPISDRLTLRVYGSKPMKVFYDERTEVYRDGAKVNLRDLQPNTRASVETMLDGTTVFARSIHLLSKAPEGEARGQVVSFDAGTHMLTLNEGLSRQSIRLSVSPETHVVREGQAATKGATTATTRDLVKGALIRASFRSDTKGGGIADQIAILALPGARMTFEGNVTHLDLHSKVLVVADGAEDQSYKITFDPASFPVSKDLREGQRVKVQAEFDGSGYQAREIAIE